MYVESCDTSKAHLILVEPAKASHLRLVERTESSHLTLVEVAVASHLSLVEVAVASRLDVAVGGVEDDRVGAVLAHVEREGRRVGRLRHRAHHH